MELVAFIDLNGQQILINKREIQRFNEFSENVRVYLVDGRFVEVSNSFEEVFDIVRGE